MIRYVIMGGQKCIVHRGSESKILKIGNTIDVVDIHARLHGML